MKAPEIEVVVESSGGGDSPITDWSKARVPEPPVRFAEEQVAVVELDGPDGVSLANTLMGRTLRVHRNGERIFRGLVKRRVRRGSIGSGRSVELRLVNQARRLLERHFCEAYTFRENGAPPGGRDAIRASAHRFTIFRAPGGQLDGDGLEPAVDGVNRSTVVRRLAGVGFTHQLDFRDNHWFLPSQVAAVGDRPLVIEDEDAGDPRPALQRVRVSPTQWSGGSEAIQTIPLRNGDPEITAQRPIQSASVVLIGEHVEGNLEPVVRVARGGDGPAEAFRVLPLEKTEDYEGSGLTAWIGEVAFDGAGDGLSALHVRFTTEGGVGTTPDRFYYARVDCETDPAFGVELGQVDEYDPGEPDPAAAWVEDDFTGKFSRVEALARVQDGAVTGDTVDNATWDMWIDHSDRLNWRERRGVDRSGLKFSLAEGGLDVIEHEEYGDRVVYQTVGLGSGRGVNQVVVVDRRPFGEGGMYEPDLDPAGSVRRFEDLPIVAAFEDTSIASRTELRARTRAAHKAWRQIRSFVRAGFSFDPSRLFFTGDRVFLDDPLAGFSGLVRVMLVVRSFSPGEGERLEVEFGETLPAISEVTREQREVVSRNATKSSPSSFTVPSAGPERFFDKDTPAAVPFAIPEGVEVERVFLKLRTLPWIANARGAEAADAGTGLNRGQRIYDRDVDIDFEGSTWTQDSRREANPEFDTLFLTVPAITDGNYIGFLTVVRVWNLSGSTGTYRYRLTNDTTGKTLFERTTTIGGNNFITDNDLWDAEDASIFDTLRVEIIEGTVGTSFKEPSYDLEINIFSVATHRHDLEFGLFRFDGDGGDGTGDPVFAREVRFAVDPTVDAKGRPVDFDGDAHPVKFGREDGPVGLLVDVTAHLETLPDGRVRPGEHFVFFRGTSRDQNEKGLGVASATAFVRTSEDAAG